MRNRSLKNKVYKNLRFDILTRKIPSGTRITEVSVAKELGVSRTPVREALQKLAMEKLITAIPRAGYLVEDLSDDDIRDLFLSHMEIQLIVMKKALEQITVGELKLLDDNIEKSRACIKSGKLDDLTDLDIQFYLIIYRASRSKVLYRVCKGLGDLALKYRHRLYIEKNLWDEAIQYHINIYQALITKDKGMIKEAIATHAEQTLNQLLDIMKKVRSDTFADDDFY